MIAVDSSVLIDLLCDAEGADAAEACLRQALSTGPVAVCEVVLSEVTAGLGQGAEVAEVLEEIGLQYSAIEQRAAVRAGEMQRKYLQRQAPAGRDTAQLRTVPDFLIGAHAMLQCTALITRDAGFFRDYFKGLRIIVPQPA